MACRARVTADEPLLLSVQCVCVTGHHPAVSTSIFKVDNTHLLCNLAKYVIIYKEDICKDKKV